MHLCDHQRQWPETAVQPWPKVLAVTYILCCTQFAASVFVDNFFTHFYGNQLISILEVSKAYIGQYKQSIFRVLTLFHNLCNLLWYAGYQLLGQILTDSNPF